VQGIPGLGNLPLLHYLFSQDHKEVSDMEVLVMLTPRVIRLPDRPTEASNKPFAARDGTSLTPEPQALPQAIPEPGRQPTFPQGTPGPGQRPNP
jgi:type II secretory pathway component GspD/PulD (secretin)